MAAMRREHPQASLAIETPQEWVDVTDPSQVVMAWAQPFEAGRFRINVTVTQDAVAVSGDWDHLRRVTWEGSAAAFDQARLVQETLDDSDDRLDRWVHYRLQNQALLLRQVTLRRHGRLVTASLTLPTMTLPSAPNEIVAIPETLEVWS